jgi:hypothetical protein
MFVLTIKPVGHQWIAINLTNVISANHGDVISKNISHIPSGTEMEFSYYSEDVLGRGKDWSNIVYKN